MVKTITMSEGHTLVSKALTVGNRHDNIEALGIDKEHKTLSRAVTVGSRDGDAVRMSERHSPVSKAVTFEG